MNFHSKVDPYPVTQGTLRIKQGEDPQALLRDALVIGRYLKRISTQPKSSPSSKAAYEAWVQLYKGLQLT